MEISPELMIPEEELSFTFARSGGPGGQNVNKVASKAFLHWNLAANTTLPIEVKARLSTQQANRITAEGALVIQSQRFRDQGRNVEDCREKLSAMILRAATPPRPRRPTKPTRGSRERRLAEKRQQAQRKEGRRRPGRDE